MNVPLNRVVIRLEIKLVSAWSEVGGYAQKATFPLRGSGGPHFGAPCGGPYKNMDIAAEIIAQSQMLVHVHCSYSVLSCNTC